VRVLGEGASAVVHLGYADTATDDEPRRTAAVKIYRADVPPERIDAEVSALAAVEHAHVVRLVDLAVAPDGRHCLVLERCVTGGLAQLVTTRARLAAGEALTILAPLASAVDALHTAGVAHGGIRMSSVLFRESGAPVLAGLGGSTRIAAGMPPAALAANAEVLDDRRRLARLVGAVLERVDHPSARELEEWLGSDPEALDDFSARLSDRLWSLGEAQPVRLRDEAGERPARAVPPRAPLPAGRDRAASTTAGRDRAATLPAGRDRVRRERSGRERAGRDRGGATVIGRSVGGADVQRASALLRGLVDHARGVRRRVWITAAGVAVSLVVAVFVVPTGEPAAQSPPGGESPTASTATRGDSGDADDDAAPVESGDSIDDPLRGDDPVAAVVALLDERARCLRDLSVLCLDGVAQPGSAALERDTAVVRALQAGGEQTADAAIDTVGPVLVERLGDSALIDLGDVPQTQPASTLVMRGEAGWRIRDYLGDATD